MTGRFPRHLAQPYIRTSHLEIRVAAGFEAQQFVDHELVGASFDSNPAQRPYYHVGTCGFDSAVTDANRRTERLVHAFKSRRDVHSVAHDRVTESLG